MIRSDIYKYKTLFLNYLDENAIAIFRLTEIELTFGSDYASVFRAIKSLTSDRLLVNLQKGLYCKPSFSDHYVLAYYLAPNGAVAYWSALSFHGLTTQFSNTVFVQTPTQIKSKTLMGMRYQFVLVKPSKAVLYEKKGRGNATFVITGVEKTLVDCFDQLDYSAGWSELIKALFKAKINSKKMIEACETLGNVSVTKRIGYLLETMQKQKCRTFIKYALGQVREKYNLLDPSDTDKGYYLAKWGLRLNVSEEEILDNVTNLY